MNKEQIKLLQNSGLLEKLINNDVIKLKHGEYILNTKYLIGTIEIKYKYALLHLETDDFTPHIEFDDLNGAYNGDIVIAKKVFHPRARNKIKVEFILNKQFSTILVYKKDYNFWTLKENIPISYTFEHNDLKELDVILLDTKTNQISRYIGNLSDPKIDEEISLIIYHEEYRLNSGFEDLEFHIPKESDNRVDLSHLNFSTIDPDTAKDFDDAIYYDEKNSTIYVAIADVSSYVLPNTAIDKEARKRAFSLYLPHKVLPMLPHKLSSDLCSLKPDVPRLSFVFKIEVDPNSLNIIDSELFEAIIISKKRFTYGRIDRVLAGKLDQYTALEKDIFDNLTNLYKFTQKLRAKRLQKGYDFRTVENKLNLDKNFELVNVETEESTPSHSLVEECMLLANIAAAKRLKKRGIFRTHEEPSMKSMQNLLTELGLLGIDASLKNDIHQTILEIQKQAKKYLLVSEVDDLIIKAQQQAVYNSNASGHFGLGFDRYSHFTSPIRRYADLVLHRILKTGEIPTDIANICDEISIKEREIDQAVWDFEDRKYARWLEKRINEIFVCEIVDVEKKVAVLKQGAIGARVKFENYHGQKLFSKVRIQIKNVNIATKEIVGTIIS
ncbi:RNB domain-containing ribonuclease [Arcobacter sp. FWKO B]|uniref:RNB domain-containing ribonuclease n=1 Tax=Arcobacter sp. FWKO B TaxID=2593672 RepID=UPI001905A9DA|nr:ribonuclease R family protein [Arcobacter sp. FWKO B]